MSAGQNCLVLTGMRLWNTDPGPAARRAGIAELTMPPNITDRQRSGIRRFYRRMRAEGMSIENARHVTLFAITDLSVGWSL